MSAIPRRRFLASSSVAAVPWLGAGTAQASQKAADASAPVEASAIHANTAWQLLALAPQSHKIPSLASDYRRGVEWGLAQHPHQNLQLHWISADAMASKATKVVEAELMRLPQLHGVMGWLPPELERRVAVLTEARGLPLWVSDSGADWREHSERPRATAFHSLDLCTRAQHLARHVFQQQGPRAVLAVGWMESGYDFVVAFQTAYRALGGRIVGRHIGGPVPQAQEFDGLRSEILRQGPEIVVAFYSGAQATRFAQWWQEHAHNQGPWALAPDLLTSAVRSATFAAPKNHQSHAWSPASWLGLQAGLGIGASLAPPATARSPGLLRQAWLAAAPVSTAFLAPRQPNPSSAASGWTNGYLQT